MLNEEAGRRIAAELSRALNRPIMKRSIEEDVVRYAAGLKRMCERGVIVAWAITDFAYDRIDVNVTLVAPMLHVDIVIPVLPK